MQPKSIPRILLYMALAVSAAIMLLPILMTLANSFMSAYEVGYRFDRSYTPANSFGAPSASGVHFAQITLIPDWATASQYINFLFKTPHYMGLFFNSVKIAAPIVIGQLVVSIPAAYAFEHMRFKGKETLFLIYIVIMLLPLQVTLVPNFIVAEFLGINGTYSAIILPAVFSPFGVFLVRQYMKGIPVDYIEAAKIDGCGQIRAFIHVALPLVKTAVAALAILVFIEYWNVVDQAAVFIKEDYLKPLSVFISSMDTDMIFAVSCFYMLPVVLVFLFGQEYMVEGIQLSGIK